MNAYVTAGSRGIGRAVADALIARGDDVVAGSPHDGDVGDDPAALVEREAMGEEGLRERLVAATPMGRMGEPVDAARLIAWLCSPDAGWVTGQLIFSDGGYLLA